MYTHTHPHSHSLARHQTHTRSIIRWLPRRRSKGARCCTTPPWWFCILMVPFLFPLHPSFPSAGNSGGEASVCLTAGRPSDTITVQPFPEYITCTAFECDVQGWWGTEGGRRDGTCAHSGRKRPVITPKQATRNHRGQWLNRKGTNIFTRTSLLLLWGLS